MELVQYLVEMQFQSADAAYDHLTEVVEIQNDRAWTVADLADQFPPTELNLILGTLKSVPVFESAFIALSLTGLELASNKRQAMILQVAAVGQWPTELTERILQLGRPLRTRWRVLGIAIEPKYGDVVLAIASAKMRLLIAAYKAKIDQALNQIGTSEQHLAVATFRAIANELEG